MAIKLNKVAKMIDDTGLAKTVDVVSQRPVTAHEREIAYRKVYKLSEEATKASKIKVNMQVHNSFHFPSTGKALAEFVFNIDSYTYTKSPQDQFYTAFRDLVVAHPDCSGLITSTPLLTEFICDGVLIKFYHRKDEMEKLKDPQNYHAFTLLESYGGFGYVLEFLYSKYGMRFGNKSILEFKFEDTEVEFSGSYKLCQVFEACLVYLDLGPTFHFSTLENFVDWLFKSKLIAKDTFYIDSENKYVGPAEHLSNKLFNQVIGFLTGPKGVSYKAVTSIQPSTVEKMHVKEWNSKHPNEYLRYSKDMNDLVNRKLLVAKVSPTMIREVLEQPDISEVRVKEIVKDFEARISKKEDYEFFILSSSQDTINSRLQSFYGQ